MTSTEKQIDAKPSSLQVLNFQGFEIIELFFQGRKGWSLSHVGKALGYAPRVLSNLINQEWRNQFKISYHYDIVHGNELKAFRKALRAANRENLLPSKSSVFTMIYEQGLDLVLLKSHKPPGRALRAFLVDRVMPSIRSGLRPMQENAINLVEKLLTRDSEKLDRLYELVLEQKYALERYASITPPLGRRDAQEILQRIATAANYVFPRPLHTKDWRQLRQRYETRVRKSASWKAHERLEDQPSSGKEAAFSCVRSIEEEVAQKVKQLP